jgi:hypothetical protein
LANRLDSAPAGRLALGTIGVDGHSPGRNPRELGPLPTTGVEHLGRDRESFYSAVISGVDRCPFAATFEQPKVETRRSRLPRRIVREIGPASTLTTSIDKTALTLTIASSVGATGGNSGAVTVSGSATRLFQRRIGSLASRGGNAFGSELWLSGAD